MRNEMITIGEVAKIYKGRAGECTCGCNGTYIYLNEKDLPSKTFKKGVQWLAYINDRIDRVDELGGGILSLEDGNDLYLISLVGSMNEEAVAEPGISELVEAAEPELTLEERTEQLKAAAAKLAEQIAELEAEANAKTEARKREDREAREREMFGGVTVEQIRSCIGSDTLIGTQGYAIGVLSDVQTMVERGDCETHAGRERVRCAINIVKHLMSDVSVMLHPANGVVDMEVEKRWRELR